MRVLGALTVAWIGGWFAVMPIYRYVEGVITPAIQKAAGPNVEYKPVFDDVTQMFMLKFKLSFYIALMAILPYIVLQVWGFIAPALKENEQKPFKRLAPASALLFLTGMGFAWLIVPETFGWFASYASDFANNAIYQKAGEQVFLVAKMLIAFGIAFQLPLIVYGIGIAGLLTSESLLRYWRQGATVIFIASAIITPSNDPVSMMMMAVPLTLLFVASVYAVKFTERKRSILPEPPEETPMTPLNLGEPIAPDETEERRQTFE